MGLKQGCQISFFAEACGKIFRSRKARQKHIKRKHVTKGEERGGGLFDGIRIFSQSIFCWFGRKLVQFYFLVETVEKRQEFKACIIDAETASLCYLGNFTPTFCVCN